MAMPENIAKMLQTEGLYLLVDPRVPNSGVPIYVDHQGNAWSMRLDSRLSPEGWLEGNLIQGPLHPRNSYGSPSSQQSNPGS